MKIKEWGKEIIKFHSSPEDYVNYRLSELFSKLGEGFKDLVIDSVVFDGGTNTVESVFNEPVFTGVVTVSYYYLVDYNKNYVFKLPKPVEPFDEDF